MGRRTKVGALVVLLSLQGMFHLLVLVALRLAVVSTPVASHDPGPGLIRGGLHIHTDRSHDGRQTLAQVLAAARELDLDFIALTDHDAPGGEPYRAPGGLLVLQGSELSTDRGHIVALGPLPPGLDARERPLDATSVMGEVQAAGGMLLLAHPASPKRPFRLEAGDRPEGLEVYNASDAARRLKQRPWPLPPLIMVYALRPRAALSLALAGPWSGALLWDDLASRQPTVAWCGLDSHGLLRTVAEMGVAHVYLRTGILPREAGEAQAVVLGALREGRGWCAHPGLADGAGLTVMARGPYGEAGPGERVAGPARLEVSAGLADPRARALAVVWRDGISVAVLPLSGCRRARWPLDIPGRYRVELSLVGPGLLWGATLRPWAYTNGIVVTAPTAPEGL